MGLQKTKVATYGNQLLPPVSEGILDAAASGFVTDAAVAAAGTFIYGELEKRDELVRTPLFSSTYQRDIPIVVSAGADWSEFISYKYVEYGNSGSNNAALVAAQVQTETPVAQANRGKAFFRTHIFEEDIRINYFDLMRGEITDYSLENDRILSLRTAYELHLNENTYLGQTIVNQYGILNQPNAVTTTVAAGASGQTEWAQKTPTEILADINNAIYETWEANGYDESARPNHIIIPYLQHQYLATTPSSDLVQGSILDFLLRYNESALNGTELIITANRYSATAGTGGTGRMAVYTMDRRFIGMEILAPLQRIMYSTNTEKKSFDFSYASNISEVMLFYPTSLRYYDGI